MLSLNCRVFRPLLSNAQGVRFLSTTLGKGPSSVDTMGETSMHTAAASAHRLQADDVNESNEEVRWSGSTPVFPGTASKPKLSLKEMSDVEVAQRVVNGKAKLFNLENTLGNKLRAVKVRRDAVETMSGRKNVFKDLPYENYDYEKIFGQCCENVIGTVPIPVGVAGPLTVDGQQYMVPMATTEGALVASTTRGCKALSLGGGVSTVVTRDGMSRAPVVQCLNVKQADEISKFVDANFDLIAERFNGTSRFARLRTVKCHHAGRKLFLRFTCATGDAMGMNMAGKATEAAMELLLGAFPEARLLALSGNVCTDKKASAINWIEGRGKSVSVDCTVPGNVVREVLKTTVEDLCYLNYSKNLVGSAIAGSIGGQNAHASNIVTACFLATGQDPAQNVESSSCMTLMEPTNNGEDLYISCTLPSLEVGTCGGGTVLPAQASMLELLGCKGVSGENEQKSSTLARIIASTVMAGELSLMSALASGHLISSHLKLNRKPGSV